MYNEVSYSILVVVNFQRKIILLMMIKFAVRFSYQVCIYTRDSLELCLREQISLTQHDFD